MEGPANTLGYFIAGYVVIFASILFYLISLIIRWRNLSQELALLEELQQDQPSTDQ